MKRFLETHLGSLRAEHLSIARGMAWVFLFVALGRLAGAAREIAIAARYGTSEIVDAYLFVFNLLTWPVAVWFSVLSVVLVPVAARLRQSEPKELASMQGALLVASLAIGSVLGVAVWGLLSILLASSVLVLPASTAALARDMLVWLTPLVPLGFVAGLYSAWLMAIGRYANTLMEAVPPLVILAVVMGAVSSGAAPLVWGTLIGFALHLVVLGGYLGRLKALARPRLSSPSRHWQAFWWSVGVMTIGQALSTASGVIDQVMAAPLGAGAIATLGYASRILALIVGLIAVAVSRVTLPVFSNMRAANDPRLLRLSLNWACLLFVAGSIGAILTYWLAPWGVAVLFERGAFTAEDSRAVAHVFSFALPQLPFYCAGLVLTTHLVAKGQYWTLTSIGAVNLAVKVAANWALIPVFGVAGITLATGVMYAISVAIMAVVVTRDIRA